MYQNKWVRSPCTVKNILLFNQVKVLLFLNCFLLLLWKRNCINTCISPQALGAVWGSRGEQARLQQHRWGRVRPHLRLWTRSTFIQTVCFLQAHSLWNIDYVYIQYCCYANWKKNSSTVVYSWLNVEQQTHCAQEQSTTLCNRLLWLFLTWCCAAPNTAAGFSGTNLCCTLHWTRDVAASVEVVHVAST